MKHVLITGGAGFIGSHLAEALIANNCRVTVIDDESTGTIENLAGVRDHFNFNYIPGTAADKSLMRRVLGDIDEVYHLAATDGSELIASAPIHAIETAIYTTELLLLELSRLARADRVVRLFLASSGEVYGRSTKEPVAEDDEILFGPVDQPQWSIGIARAAAESLALAYWRQHRLPIVIGRFFNVVGPRQNGDFGAVVPRFIHAALQGEPLVIYGTGKQRRCFVHVTDIVDAMIQLMEHPQTLGQVFNLGGDEPISIEDLAARIVAAVRPGLAIKHQRLEDVLGNGFEERGSGVPDLKRLRATVGFQASYSLDDIIREVATIARARSR